MPLESSVERQLARTFAPILYLHPDEEYFPMDPQDFVEKSRLWRMSKKGEKRVYDIRRNRFVEKKHQKSIRFGLPANFLRVYERGHVPEGVTWNRRPRDPKRNHSEDAFALEYFEKTPHSRFEPHQPPPCYYFVDDRGSFALVSYWTFYGYSRFMWRVGHQGDWEHCTFQIRNGRIESAFFAVHENKSYVRAPGLRLEDGRVQIFSAKNRHGTWWKEGSFHVVDPLVKKAEVDEVLERGLFLEDETEAGERWDLRHDLRRLTDQDWRHFAGAWGAIGGRKHTTGPLGPWFKRFLRGSETVVVEKTRGSLVRGNFVLDPSGSLPQARVLADPLSPIPTREAMSPDLVFVHGRSQQGKDPDVLKASWIRAWKRGLAKHSLDLPLAEEQIRFPFYGDMLDDMQHGATPDSAAAIEVRAKLEEDEQAIQLFGAILAEFIDARGIEANASDADAVNVARTRGIQNWDPLQKMLECIDRKLPKVSSSLIAIATKDVSLYLRRAEIRDTINGGVRLAVRSHVPTILVSHSLGTVVAYDLLRTESEILGWNIPLFVTLGSPLAISPVRESVSPLKFPSTVDRWFNAMDEEDVVSLFALDADNFPVTPEIENHRKVENHTNNQHGIDGYLDDPVVAKKIYDAVVAAS